MKKIGLLFILGLVLLQPLSVMALTAGEAKQEWLDSKQESLTVQQTHRDAKVTWAANKTDENNQLVIDTGKEVLHAALNEVEAWLIWRNLDAEENPLVPSHIKESIQQDVDTNLGKISELRIDVDNVDTQFGLGIVFLQMIGKYFELLADVARNTGSMWVHIGNTRADTVEDYEMTLRAAAEPLSDNEEIIAKLDLARTELETARTNINNAEAEYEQVVLPGTPLIKFANGNNYLRIARNNLINAHSYLRQAYLLMVTEGE